MPSSKKKKSPKPKCKDVIKSGQNKGNQCPNDAIFGTLLCGIHTKKSKSAVESTSFASKAKCEGFTKNGERCKKNATQKGYCNAHYNSIYGNTIVGSAINSLNSRHSDTSYYLVKLIYALKYKDLNKPIDEVDGARAKKEELFGKNDCFITGEKNVGVGDHLYAIRQYAPVTGEYGMNDDWNRIPVSGSINKNYKNFMFADGHSKDIGYEILTEEELEELRKEKEDGIKDEKLKKKLEKYKISRFEIYKKIREWIDYVEGIGIKLSFPFDTHDRKFMEDHKNDYLKINEKFVQNVIFNSQLNKRMSVETAITNVKNITGLTHKGTRKSRQSKSKTPQSAPSRLNFKEYGQNF